MSRVIFDRSYIIAKQKVFVNSLSDKKCDIISIFQLFQILPVKNPAATGDASSGGGFRYSGAFILDENPTMWYNLKEKRQWGNLYVSYTRRR